MKGMPHAWRRDDAGAEAVEFAIIVPVLLALLTGIITFAIRVHRPGQHHPGSARRGAVRRNL